MATVFFEIGIVIVISTLFGYLARLIKQPLIPAYIITGLLIGPVFGLVKEKEVILTTAEIGIALLLFIVGLEMDLKKLKHVSIVSSLGGTLQTAIVFFAGFLVALLFGIFSRIEAVYIGLILAFSSTMIVVKLLSDKKEIDTLHGRIVIGILLMQDILAILALSVLTTLENFSVPFLALAFVKGGIVFLIAYLCKELVFPGVFKLGARSSEMLFLLAVSVCFLFSMLFTYFGFSIAIGAFVGGVALANLPYSFEIIGRVKSLRDFFSTIFFVSLGLELSLFLKKELVLPLLVFLILVVVFKPFVIMVLVSLFGYKEKPAFLTAISLAQVSEFSLIIVAQGMLLGHLSRDIFSITVILAIITLGLSSYFIDFDNKFYGILKNYLGIFGKISDGHQFEYIPGKAEKDVVLFGYDRLGYEIYEKLKSLKKKVLIIDFNPMVIRNLINKNIPCIYGDMGDLEILDRIDLRNIGMVISTVPNREDNFLLVKKTKEVNKKAVIFVTANVVDDALDLYDAGADYVILPHFLGGAHASLIIEDFDKDIKKVLKTKFNHIKELRYRKMLGHEHPIKLNH